MTERQPVMEQEIEEALAYFKNTPLHPPQNPYGYSNDERVRGRVLAAAYCQERAARQAAGARLARFQTAYLAGKPDVLESFCFYCEATYPYGKEVDLEHITACQKHPVVALLAERDALREQLARLKTELEHYETTEEIEELLK